MAKKNSIPIRIDEDTYNDLKCISKRTNKSMREITSEMMKSMKGKKLNFEIKF